MAIKTRVLVGLGVVAAVALMAGLWGLRETASRAGAQQALTVTMGPGRDAAQSPGTATLTATGNQTEVTIDIAPGAAGVGQPAHIHEGGCPGVGAVKFPLTNVVDGKSTTVVNATLADLQAGNLAINIHRSQEEIGVYVSCGNIPATAAAPAPAPAPGAPPTTGSGGLLDQGDSGLWTWWYALAVAGGVLAVGGVLALGLARRRA